jgi:hypothetical protein
MTVHDLDLIRAATEDVDSARMLLQQRTEALDAIIQTALDHGVPVNEVAEASDASRTTNEEITDPRQPVLAA